MAVYKAEILASEADAKVLAGLLTEILDPPPATSLRETQAGFLLELYFTELPDPAVLEAIDEGLPDADLIRRLKPEPLPEEDWVAKTQRGLHPIEAGRFFVHGSHDRARARGRPFAIEIDAGQAFGTAHHGTTRGCLIMLDRLAKKGRSPRALDLGTGSGVLAIAAAKTLCRDVLATDIDPVAIYVARENFARNGINRQLTAITASGLNHPAIAAKAPFNLVMANILAAPLISLAPGIRKVMEPRGHLLLSGLLDQHARHVCGRYMAQGFVFGGRLSLDGWTTLHLQA